jgi:hypothetical protein
VYLRLLVFSPCATTERRRTLPSSDDLSKNPVVGLLLHREPLPHSEKLLFPHLKLPLEEGGRFAIADLSATSAEGVVEVFCLGHIPQTCML